MRSLKAASLRWFLGVLALGLILLVVFIAGSAPRAMQIELEPTTASLTIGGEDEDDYAKTNTIEFKIKLTGNEPVWLTLQIPVGEDGVLRQAEDANDIVVETLGNNWLPRVPDSTDTTKEWRLGDYDTGVQVSGSTELSVSISNIPCRANEGETEITVIAKTETTTYSKKLTITKVKPSPEEPTPSPEEPILSTEGWHALYPLGKDAFPSVIFDTADSTTDALYAIFVRNDGTGGRKAVLCKSTDGIMGWEVINEAVPDRMESSPGVQLGNRLWLIGGSAVDPDRKSNRICYYDLDKPNEGWRDATVTFSKPNEGWRDATVTFSDPADAPAELEERMGHACVIVDDTIWVLGGLDKYHTCVNDVWSLTIGASGEAVTAERLKKKSNWSPRCMFSAVNFNNMIWVCGGVSSPNGNPLGDLWATGLSDIAWEKRPTGKEGSVVANAIGTGAAACGDTLFTLITNRTGGPNWRLNAEMWAIGKSGITATSDTWAESSQPRLPTDLPSTPHSIAVVGFKNRLYVRRLYRNDMYGEVVGAPLYVYVQCQMESRD